MHYSNLSAAMTKITPVAFNGCSGSLHCPAGVSGNGAAVVICPAAGRDARWTYRSLFLWAEMLAAQGYHVLRYDHPGEGDSAPLGLDEDQWGHWASALENAASYMRSRSGISQLFICGLRIGATLACVTAPKIKADGLILWDPFAAGKVWLKEIRLAQAMQTGAHDPDIAEANGLRLSAATVKTLDNVSITTSKNKWPPILLAAPVASKSLQANFGEQVETVRFSGYTALFKDAHVNMHPAELFNSTLQWLGKYLRPFTSAPLPALPDMAMEKIQGDGWREKPVTFGKGLRGILCLPAGTPPRQFTRVGVLMGNTAADPRSGVGNFSSRTCRWLAAAGIASIRFDFSGYGESDGEAPHVYETSRTEDFRMAAAVLISYGIDTIIAAGVCTGGFHAVRAVLESSDIHHAIAINAWLTWQPGTQLDRSAQVESMRSVYLRVPVQARKGLRAIRDAIHTGLVPRLVRLSRMLSPSPAATETLAQFKKASARGAKVHLILGALDRSLDGLEEFGIRGRRLTKLPGMSVKILNNLDHALFYTQSQDLVIGEILTFLDLPSVVPDSGMAAEYEAPSNDEYRPDTIHQPV